MSNYEMVNLEGDKNKSHLNFILYSKFFIDSVSFVKKHAEITVGIYVYI